MCGQDVT